MLVKEKVTKYGYSRTMCIRVPRSSNTPEHNHIELGGFCGLDSRIEGPGLILNPSGPGFCDRGASRLVERRQLNPPSTVNLKFRWSIIRVKRRSLAVSVTLLHVGHYYLEIVADDWNNQPRRCGIWVCRVSMSKMLTGMIAIRWSRVTYMMQQQHGVSLRLAPALQTSLLTRFVRTLNLGLLTFRQGKPGNYRLILSLRSPRRRWPQLSLSAFLEMRTGS
jgi:hypothetical protein